MFSVSKKAMEGRSFPRQSLVILTEVHVLSEEDVEIIPEGRDQIEEKEEVMEVLIMEKEETMEDLQKHKPEEMKGEDMVEIPKMEKERAMDAETKEAEEENLEREDEEGKTFSF